MSQPEREPLKSAILECQGVAIKHSNTKEAMPDLEVIGICFPDGTERTWSRARGEHSQAYYGEKEERRLLWSEKMLGRLALFCNMTLATTNYQSYIRGNGLVRERVLSEPWNCHKFAAMMAPEYELSLKPDESGFPLPQGLRVGDEIAPDGLENGRPYYMGEPERIVGGEHSLVGTNFERFSLGVCGAQQPLSLTKVEDLLLWYPGGVYPYLSLN